MLRYQLRLRSLDVKVKGLLRLLADDGWELTRTRGSHRQLRHPSKPGTVTVAGKPSVEVPKGTLGSILRQAGLKNEGKEKP